MKRLPRLPSLPAPQSPGTPLREANTVIKQIASCPYCRQGEVAYDCDAMELTFNPDNALQHACPHLLWVSGTYCGTEVSTDGSRHFGMARVAWQDPALAGVSHGDVVGCAEELAAGAGDEEAEPALKLEHVRLEMARQLSRRELARWLDEVGWETGDEDWPSAEQSLHGMVLFARLREPFFSRLADRRKAS
jgi:hypothetical protein